MILIVIVSIVSQWCGSNWANLVWLYSSFLADANRQETMCAQAAGRTVGDRDMFSAMQIMVESYCYINGHGCKHSWVIEWMGDNITPSLFYCLLHTQCRTTISASLLNYMQLVLSYWLAWLSSLLSKWQTPKTQVVYVMLQLCKIGLILFEIYWRQILFKRILS